MSTQSGQSKELSKGDTLAMPEILLLVGQFLSCRTLAQCLLVCHPWHLTLKPLLWKELEIWLLDTTQLPPLPDVQKNAHFIRKLTIEYQTLADPLCSLSCPHLENLTVTGISFCNQNSSSVGESHLHNWIQKHCRTLRTVTIQVSVGENTLKALLDCPRLEALIFTEYIKVRYTRWMQIYQKLRLRLHTFSLSGPGFVRHAETEDFTLVTVEEWNRAHAEPSRIRDLTLYIVDPDESVGKVQLWMMEKCFDLTRLKWRSGRGLPHDHHTQMTRSLANILQAGRHSKLEDVDLSNTSFDNEDLEKLLKSIRCLRALNVNWSNFRSTSWEKLQALPSHLQTLVSLDVKFCHGLSNLDFQMMLCSLPSLKIFRAGILSEAELENDPRPWVCHDLEDLSLGWELIHGDLSSKWTLDYLRRINQLSKLRTWMGTTPYEKDSGLEVKWKVHGGLDQLSGLRGLQTVGWNIVSYGLEELQWILDHWPNIVQPPRHVLENRVRDLMHTANQTDRRSFQILRVVPIR